MSISFVDVVIKTTSPIEIWDEEEVKPFLATADQHIKALFEGP
jgi:hypothetical protein